MGNDVWGHSQVRKNGVCYLASVLTGDSLIAQLIKNPPAIQETWVQFLSWEDPLEKGKTTEAEDIKKRWQKYTEELYKNKSS